MRSSYLQEVEAVFSTNANAENAKHMKAYMKDQFEHYGIKIPDRRALQKSFFAKEKLPDMASLPELVKECFEHPKREMHHFGWELALKFVRKNTVDALDIYEYMIITHSWWDTVDMIASKLVGIHMRRFPELIQPTNKKWMKSGNIWLQRTAILFQKDYKETTDAKLLFSNCKALADHPDFFIRKVIGWMLREYSRTDPEAVKEFVSETPLSPLSAKEALRNLPS